MEILLTCHCRYLRGTTRPTSSLLTTFHMGWSLLVCNYSVERHPKLMSGWLSKWAHLTWPHIGATLGRRRCALGVRQCLCQILRHRPSLRLQGMHALLGSMQLCNCVEYYCSRRHTDWVASGISRGQYVLNWSSFRYLQWKVQHVVRRISYLFTQWVLSSTDPFFTFILCQFFFSMQWTISINIFCVYVYSF